MTPPAPSHPDALQRCTLQSDTLRAVVLPQLGGKVAALSLMTKNARLGAQILQGPLKPYSTRAGSLPFEETDGSGWDECLPSIGACEISYDGGAAEIPDHGEFWRMPWTVEAQSEESVRISAMGQVLPLFFERTITLRANRLTVQYMVGNRSATAVPYLWSAHPLLAVDAGDRIILPQSVTEVTTGSSANGRLGEAGSSHSWPFTADARDGGALDLTTVGHPADGVGDKIVARSPAEGWCAIDRLTLNKRVTLRFDPEANPWLGLWICYGGWPASAASRKGFTVALEPCTSPVDSLAEALGRGEVKTLASGAEERWEVSLEVTSIKK